MPEESHIVLGPKHLRILVLGETGARKLSFIRLATGCDAQVGDGANPCWSIDGPVVSFFRLTLPMFTSTL